MAIISGTNNNDTITGTSSSDIILSGNGNDTINSGGGTDIIDAGNGNDTVNAGSGDDIVDGGNGNDTIDGGSGTDILLGGNGDDTLNGGSGSDLVSGGSGNDILIYNVAENQGSIDIYDGGKGVDNLNLVFSQSILSQLSASSGYSTTAAYLTALQNYFNSHVGQIMNFQQFGFNLGGLSVETLNLTIQGGPPANTAPIAQAQSVTTQEDNSIAITLVATDAENNPLTYTILTGPTNGTLTGSGANWTYTPNANYFGSDSFTFIANDGSLNSNTATVSLNVTPVNDLPAAASDAFTVNEDAVLNGSLAGNDTPSGDGGNVWSLLTQAANGVVTVNADGTFTYTPNSNFNGTDSFTYNLTDANGDVVSATATITVNSVNDLPTAANDSYSVNEDAILNGNLADNDTPSGDGSNVWSLLTQAANGVVVVNTDGMFTYTPNSNFNGTDSFTYNLTDANGDVVSATATITVNSVNDLPEAADDAFTVDEDGILNGNLAGNDAPSGDGGNVWSLLMQAANGVVVVNADGTFTYTPNSNFNGEDSFTYNLTDANGDVVSATATITVNAVNDLPVAADDAFSVDEDGILNGNLAGNDTPSGDGGNTWSLVTSAAHGLVLLNTDGTFTYTPNENFTGEDSFTYNLTDADGDTVTATATITVDPVNDAPVAVDNSYTLNEDDVLSVSAGGTAVGGNGAGGVGGTGGTGSGGLDGGLDPGVGGGSSAQAAGILGNDEDVDQDALAAILVEGPQHGTLTLNPDGTFNYTPHQDYNGTDSFTYIANDGTADSNIATVHLTINAVNDAPIIISHPASLVVNEDDGQELQASLMAVAGPANESGQNLTYSFTSLNPELITVNSQSMNFASFSQVQNANGVATILVTVTDDGGTANGGQNSTTTSFTITVNAVDDAPIFNPIGNQTVDEGSPLTFSVAATDVDSPILAYNAINLPLGAIFNAGTQTFSWMPTYEQAGNYTVTFEATDGTSTVTRAVQINVNDVAPPEISINDVSVVEGNNVGSTREMVFTVTLSNPSSQVVTVNYTTVGTPNTTSPTDFIAQEGMLTFNPGETSKTISITINEDVQIESTNESFAVNLYQATNATISDFQGRGTIINDDIEIRGTNSTSFVEGNEGVTMVNVAVRLAAPSPNAISVDYYTTDLTAIAGEDYIPTSGTITFAPGETIKNITVGINGDMLIEPNQFFQIKLTNPTNGGQIFNDTMQVGILNDESTINVGTTTGIVEGDDGVKYLTVNVHLQPGNALPVTVNYSTADGTALAGSDYLAASGTLTFNPGQVTQTVSIAILGDTLFEGNERFTLNLSDPTNGVIGNGTILISITNNDPQDSLPIAADDNFLVDEDDALDGNLAGNDTPSADGGNIWSLVSGTANGNIVVNADGTFTYNPGANFNGSDSFTYKITDADGDISTATAAITVNPVNDAPIASSFEIYVNEDSPANQNITYWGQGVGDLIFDTDGDQLLVQIVSQPNYGNIYYDSNMIEYGPIEEYSGEDSFTYRVFDGTAWSNVATVTVAINPMDDPVTTADDTATGELNAIVTGNVLTNDLAPDGGLVVDPLDLTTANGHLVLNADGSYTFTPNAGFAGTESFDYTAYDADGSSDIGNLSITINESSLPPLFTNADDGVLFFGLQEGTYLDGTQYDALGGNDTVVLPGSFSQAEAAGYGFIPTSFILNSFNGGDGNDIIATSFNLILPPGSLIPIATFGADGTARYIIDGGAGNDLIYGGQNNDILSGAEGNDTLIGGNGVDTLSGGAGSDTFLFNPDPLVSLDLVIDFVTSASNPVEHDILDVRGYNITFEDLTITQSGSDTTVNIDGVNSIQLANVTNLSETDFLFS